MVQMVNVEPYDMQQRSQHFIIWSFDGKHHNVTSAAASLVKCSFIQGLVGFVAVFNTFALCRLCPAQILL